MLPTSDEGVHAPSRVDVPPVPVGREFGHLTIGPITVTLIAGERCPTNRGYFLHDDLPAIEFGPDPDASTIGNALWAMAMLLGLAPVVAGLAVEVSHG
jgi:hypothetical protein